MSLAASDILADKLGPLFSYDQVHGFTRIRTPFLYPDGDVIDVFLQEKSGVMTVTDLGETMRWLRGQSISPRRSAKQRALIDDVCLNHGVELFHGMLVARVKPGDNLAFVVMRAAQACLRAADVWFTMRTRSVESVTEEVEVFLSEKGIGFERSTPLVGRSGRTWRPDFHTRTPKRSSLVCVLSTGSRAAAKNVTDHVLAGWFDLNHMSIGPEGLQFISLFDDTMDVWSEQDFNLLKDLSTVSRWSQPEAFLETLAVDSVGVEVQA
jgi:hypothetical protein